MKLTLISPYSEITSFGLRTISSSLKREGHSVKMIFLPDIEAEYGDDAGSVYAYPPEVVEQTIEICKGAEIVGFTLMTYYFDRVVYLSKKIKQALNVPIIWGGIHPTIRPDESLEYADIVCIGEGEEAVVELLQKMESGKDYFKTRNFYFKDRDKIYINKVRPLIRNLDTIPYPDYELNTQYVWNKKTGTIDKFNKEMFKKHLSNTAFYCNKGLIPYQTMVTRGCLFNCSYCCNSVLRKLYSGQTYVRRRGVKNFIGELELVKKEFPFIQAIDICDDSFFDGNEEEIEEFSITYKSKIGIPFRCLASPLTITSKKMDDLVNSGLFMIQMGIETGSKKGKSVYKRNIPNDKIINAARIICRYKDYIDAPLYDIIVDNPYEDYKDNIETMKLLLKLPKPYEIQIFSLVFYYGTALYEKAKKDGILGDEGQLIYRKQFFKYRQNYLNLIMALIKKQIPASLIRILLAPWVVNIFSMKPFEKLFSFLFKGYHFFKESLKKV